MKSSHFTVYMNLTTFSVWFSCTYCSAIIIIIITHYVASKNGTATRTSRTNTEITSQQSPINMYVFYRYELETTATSALGTVGNRSFDSFALPNKYSLPTMDVLSQSLVDCAAE